MRPAPAGRLKPLATLTRTVLVGLGSVFATSFLVRAAFGAVVVLLSGHVGGPGKTFGLLVALIPLMEMATVPFIGVWSDRLGHRRVLIGGLVVATLAMGLRTLSTSAPIIILANLAQGVSAAATLVPALALIADIAPPAHRGSAMGGFDFLSVFGAFFGYVAGFLMAGFAPPISFGVLAVILGLGTIYGIQTLPEAPVRAHAVQMRDIIATARDPAVALVVSPWLVAFMFIGGLVTFFPRAALNSLGWGTVTIAIGVTAFGAIVGVSQVLYGHLSDRVGRGPILILGAVGFATLMLGTGLLILDADGDPQRFVALMLRDLPVLLPAFLASLAFGPASLAALADASVTGHSGVTMSLYSMVLAAGYALGPLILGVTSDRAASGGPMALALYHVLLGLTLVGLVLVRQAWKKGAFGRRAAPYREI